MTSNVGDECHVWKEAEIGEMSDLGGWGLRDRLHETPTPPSLIPPFSVYSLFPFFTYLSATFSAFSHIGETVLWSQFRVIIVS